MPDRAEPSLPPVTELSPVERRVLGVLVEKALTTPEYYPLTAKALVAGCNQKSNRDPVANYEEDAVLEAVESLRKLGLATEVHTSSGRTARYRHFLRQRFTVTEPQVAILTELLLRGRQTLGELRSRAARMVPIDGLDALRDELRGLIDARLVQANGPLERRGVEVDHLLYKAREGKTLPAGTFDEDDAAVEPRPMPREEPFPPIASSSGMSAGDDRTAALERAVSELRAACAALRADLDASRRDVRDLRAALGETGDPAE
ncbi:MAG: DUF480 domain-containing protein [Planctomycetaceae bacterium]